MDSFAFHPELFELRNDVLELLAEHGFAWLSDYGSVDMLHDVFGLEVCGIHQEEDARDILKLLQRKFVDWRHTRMYHREAYTREPGWKVIISRDPEDYQDRRLRVN